MTTASTKITHDFPGFFKVYEDGRIERYWNSEYVPPGLDPETGIQSKDVVISSETGVKARIFLPKIKDPSQKLPLLVHYHGGGFCIGSAFSSSFSNFLSALVSQANVIAMSVEYRLAPEHLLPIAYDDSWAALQWVAKHSEGEGPESWINKYADLDRVILAGESAGATLAHYVAVQAGARELAGVKITRLLIVHPYFGRKEPDPIYKYMCPTSSGADDDPKLNPAADPNLKKMKCDNVLVCLAEKDFLKSRGEAYYATMGKCGWGGKVEYYESKGEEHCFHFFNPNSDNIEPLIIQIVDFIKH
ncbi:2-hydroxyisoflavanone dehydratase [Ricinus communis]|uniref:Arylacetamide deacetylase, putative n=1 Tax=Ricinus communis TaxID=3988 RepID=B9RY26_RICCO|nr:2-hydroxyisoflavanone dehydratase [Ricinus communis]EEF43718.1 Arylacetamide deacetylase, putative [Ricinus communis]|eukprot:XP_002518793.1 2-hydroxyisoflavanone dehydratase [Ricinus communis]